MQHNPRKGTKRNGFFHHYSLSKIRECSFNQLFKWRFLWLSWKYVQNAWLLTEKVCASCVCKQDIPYINFILPSAEGCWQQVKYTKMYWPFQCYSKNTCKHNAGFVLGRQSALFSDMHAFSTSKCKNSYALTAWLVCQWYAVFHLIIQLCKRPLTCSLLDF